MRVPSSGRPDPSSEVIARRRRVEPRRERSQCVRIRVRERAERLAEVVDDRLDARARLDEVPVQCCELVLLVRETRGRRLDAGRELLDTL